MNWFKNFLSNIWVKFACIVMWVIATAVLIYDGVTLGELNDLGKLIIGLGTALTLIIMAVRNLLKAKDTDKK